MTESHTPTLPEVFKTLVSHLYIRIWSSWLTFTDLQWMKTNFKISQFSRFLLRSEYAIQSSLYVYHFSTVIDFSSEKYSGPTGHRNSWYQQRNLQWICRMWDSNSQPLDYKPSALAIELQSSKAIAGKELSLSSWCIASLYIYNFSTVIDFSSEK